MRERPPSHMRQVLLLEVLARRVVCDVLSGSVMSSQEASTMYFLRDANGRLVTDYHGKCILMQKPKDEPKTPSEHPTKKAKTGHELTPTPPAQAWPGTEIILLLSSSPPPPCTSSLPPHPDPPPSSSWMALGSRLLVRRAPRARRRMAPARSNRRPLFPRWASRPIEGQGRGAGERWEDGRTRAGI